MRERLQKILSRAGIASRRAAEALILDGRVEVDGVVIRELGSSADPESQEIRVDGNRLRSKRPRRYIVLNKPVGYVVTRSDPEKRRTVMQLLPQAFKDMYPVGRLDMASSGVLVLTDDGDFAQKLAHPKFRVTKTYRLTVRGVPSIEVLARAKRGLTLDGERLSVERADLLSSSEPKSRASKHTQTRLRIVLRQGRNRELRRLFEALGHPVVRLHRERVGNLSDRGLPRGAFRPLRAEEIDDLMSTRSDAEKAPRRPGRRPSATRADGASRAGSRRGKLKR